MEITVSPKSDNRIALDVDGSGNARVRMQAWGKTISTPLGIAQGSRLLTTGGQTQVNPNHGIFPNPPAYSISSRVSMFSNANQCFLFNGVGMAGASGQRDFRTYWAGGGGTVGFGCDGNGQTNVCTSAWWGGHMFVPGDALAGADVIITSGSTTLQTRIVGYTDFQNVTLRDPWPGATIAPGTPTSMFLGRIVYGPGYHQAVAMGTDATGGGYLVVHVYGNYAFVGYVMGANAASASNPMANTAIGLRLIWAGRIERPGTNFYPQIWITNPTPSSAVNIHPVYIATGDPITTHPQMTLAEMFPTTTPGTDYPFGGDSGHPSNEAVMRAFEVAIGAQDWSTGVPPNTRHVPNRGVVQFLQGIARSARRQVSTLGSIITGTEGRSS